MNSLKTTFIAAAFALSGTTFAIGAEPIVGNWKTAEGETAAISKCGGSFCIKLKTGDHAGKRIGKMSGGGSSYNGTITDPADDKVYTGSAKLSGSSMKLKGCALKIFCKTVTWRKI
ncbi:MAG: DUF2147 domain-containing protein [Pseudomonadota bacterium]